MRDEIDVMLDAQGLSVSEDDRAALVEAYVSARAAADLLFELSTIPGKG